MGALGTGGIYEAAAEQPGCGEEAASTTLDGASVAGFNPDNP